MPKKKISITWEQLETLYTACQGADGFEGQDATIWLTINKDTILSADMVYVPEPAENAELHVDLTDI